MLLAGSQFFRDAHNVLVGSGVKNFLGNTKQFYGNLIIKAGVHGIDCFQSDGAAATGNANHTFVNNTCVLNGLSMLLQTSCLRSRDVTDTKLPMHCFAGPSPYTPHNSNATVGSKAFRDFYTNSSFTTAGNHYYNADGRVLIPIGAHNLSLQELQQAAGAELGSSQSKTPSSAAIIAMARSLLVL